MKTISGNTDQLTAVSARGDEHTAARPSTSTPRRSLARLRAIGWASLPPLTFVAIIVGWGVVVRIFDIPAYLLPGPIDVFGRLAEDRASIANHALTTMSVIGIGFGLTIVIAIPLGLFISLSKLVRQVVYPPVMLLQLLPKIAIAPLLLVWLGFGMSNKVLLTVLISFFPLVLASVSGFSILDDRLLYLTKSMGASRWQTFRFLRVPSALPIIFAGIKTSATIAITAALVAEFLGSNSGLGFLLLRASGTLDTELIFAILVVLTAIGIAVNYLVEAAEWIMTPWQRHKSS